MDKFHILIIDDDRDIALYFQTVMMLMGFEVEIVLSAKDALATLATNVPDLILLDMRLGREIGGEDILYQIRSNPRFDSTRVIVITGYPTTVEMVANLADLVLIKPVGVDQLRALVSRMATFEVEPKTLPFRDPVTLLFNKEFFYTRLELAFERSRRRADFRFAVTLFQVQLCGQSEDETPPEVLATILAEIARRLKGHLRPTDTIARVSGWRFVTLHEDLRQNDDVGIIIDRLRQLLAEPFQIGEDVYKVMTTFGWTGQETYYPSQDAIFNAVEKSLENELSTHAS